MRFQEWLRPIYFSSSSRPSASEVVVRRFGPWPRHTKDIKIIIWKAQGVPQ